MKFSSNRFRAFCLVRYKLPPHRHRPKTAREAIAIRTVFLVRRIKTPLNFIVNRIRVRNSDEKIDENLRTGKSTKMD